VKKITSSGPIVIEGKVFFEFERFIRPFMIKAIDREKNKKVDKQSILIKPCAPDIQSFNSIYIITGKTKNNDSN
jgi:hypothetical protein